MTQIITGKWWGWWWSIDKYVADVPYECWEWEDKAISWDKVYAKVSDMENTLNTALQPWDNISDLCNDAWYIDSSALAWYALACDIPTDNAQLSNGCSYVTSWDLPDFSKYQLTCNLVTSLSGADDTHYPSAKAVSDALSCAGAGDMMKSVYDPNNCAKDAFNYCNMYNQPTIPTVCNVLNSSCTNQALSAKQGCVLNSCISTINWKIPTAATTTNQLADKDYVDNSINSVAAYYITKNAAGDQFATYAELSNATTFYSGWVVRTPTRNDYAVVVDDETHSDETTRYSYQWSWWQYQYTINETPLTTAQLNALNSWITSAKVSSYDGAVSTIGWYWDIVSCNASCFATASQWWKADTALQPNDNISELNNDTWYITWVAWGSITWTLSNQTDLCTALWNKANDSDVVKLSWAQTVCWTKTFCTSPVVPSKTSSATNTGTAIATEAQVYTVANTLSWVVNDTAFWISWDWDTTHAPSKNAIYDVLGDVETLLANL